MIKKTHWFLFPTCLRAELSADPGPTALCGRVQITALGRKTMRQQGQKHSLVLCCQSAQAFPPLAPANYQHDTALCPGTVPPAPHPPSLCLPTLSSQKETLGCFKALAWAGLLVKLLQLLSGTILTACLQWSCHSFLPGNEPCFYNRTGSPLCCYENKLIIIIIRCYSWILRQLKGTPEKKITSFTLCASLPFLLVT